MRDSSNILRAFSVDHVVKLTGLTKRQLRYWDDTGFFSPHFPSVEEKGSYSRIYSFRDVVGLRTISILRNDYTCPLQHLRKVAKELRKHATEPWSDIKLYVFGKAVYFKEPTSKQMRGVVNKQYTYIRLQDIANDVQREVNKLRKRSPEQVGQIDRHRNVVRNAWVVAGTRIPAKAIQRFHEAGYSIMQILQEYPSLTRKDVAAALAHEDQSFKSA